MIIEVSGVGFRNMGAELMLVAAREELRSWESTHDAAIGLRVGTRAERRRVDCGLVLRSSPGARRWTSQALRTGRTIVPTALLRRTRLYRPSMVDALLDASGFAFGDQWGPQSARQLGSLFESYHVRGRPVVLLPQAFGPFTEPEASRAASEALDYAELIFARDSESLENLESLNLARPELRLAPDFTNLVEPVPWDHAEPTVAVIPNVRMTDMPGSIAEDRYLAFLRACVVAAREAGQRVLVVGHEPADMGYAQRLSEEHGSGVSTYRIRDAVEAKAVIGGCELVVSSRFHGLVNAMSQAVPAVGTSWSHKYRHLFEDYGCPEALWETADPQHAHDRLVEWLEPAALTARRKALRGHADRLKHASRAMWSEVSQLLRRERSR